jgi:DNA invertase Pin-like site-specific DNA recombinase
LLGAISLRTRESTSTTTTTTPKGVRHITAHGPPLALEVRRERWEVPPVARTRDLEAERTSLSALIFKRLQFKQVPLIGVADGIDTSEKHAKLSFTVKSLVADLYLDDLRDKTLRGLEGRALAGFATGNVAYDHHTVPITDEHGAILGNRIEIHEGEAKIIVRIFKESSVGRSLATIAHGLNKDGIPSPRAAPAQRCATTPRSSMPSCAIARSA